MNKNQIIAGFFFILFLFVLYQLLLIFSPFFKAIFWASILAFIFYPLHNQIKILCRGSATTASVLSTLLILSIVLPFTAIVIFSVAVEAVKLYELASQTFTAETIKGWLNYLKSLEPISYLLTKIGESDDLQQNLTNFILSIAKFFGNYAAGFLTSITKNILIIVINVLLVIFLLFFFFLDGKKIINAVKDVLPMEKKNKNAIFNKIGETLSAVIRGQFVTALIQGVIASFIYWILGLPIPLFFGFLTFISSMIPVTGAGTVWVPIVIYFFSVHEAVKAVILLILGTFLISLIDNFLKPYLIGEKTKLPILLLFLGILGGLKIYGLTGIFLGPVIIALAFALIRIYQEEYMGPRNR